MENKKEIGTYFKNQLEQLEVQPQHSTWVRIENTLQKRKKRYSLFLLLLTFGFILSIATVVFFAMDSAITSNSASRPELQKEKTSIKSAQKKPMKSRENSKNNLLSKDKIGKQKVLENDFVEKNDSIHQSQIKKNGYAREANRKQTNQSSTSILSKTSLKNLKRKNNQAQANLTERNQNNRIQSNNDSNDSNDSNDKQPKNNLAERKIGVDTLAQGEKKELAKKALTKKEKNTTNSIKKKRTLYSNGQFPFMPPPSTTVC